MGNNEMNNAAPKIQDGVGRPAKHDPDRAETDVNASLVERLAESSPSPAVHAEWDAQRKAREQAAEQAAEQAERERGPDHHAP